MLFPSTSSPSRHDLSLLASHPTTTFSSPLRVVSTSRPLLTTVIAVEAIEGRPHHLIRSVTFSQFLHVSKQFQFQST